MTRPNIVSFVNDMKAFTWLPEILFHRSQYQAEQIAFMFLIDGERKVESINYRELWQRSNQIAEQLALHTTEGHRVLMLFEPGIEYITALFGIFLAHCVAIPSFPPIGKRGWSRYTTIIHNAEPEVILVCESFSNLDKESSPNSTPIQVTAPGKQANHYRYG